MDDLYLDSILDIYKHPHSKGWIGGGGVHTSKAINASCGDQFEIALVWEGGKVAQAKWRGSGCAISTAAVDYVVSWMVGKTKKELETANKELIGELVGIDAIAPAREKCLYLPLRWSFFSGKSTP